MNTIHLTENDISKFCKNTNIPMINNQPNPNECWNWVGKKHHGRGVFVVPSLHINISVVRVAYFLAHNVLPRIVYQTCSNKLCINPQHLYCGHGQTHTREYKTFEDIRYRILNPNHQAYPDYGGRGIDMDPRYIGKNRTEGYNNFILDLKELNMYPIPTGMSIDRIDNDKGYWKNNIKLSTPHEQALNRRTSILTLEDADNIRQLYSSGKYYQRELAKMYNVCEVHIGKIINNQRLVK